MEWKKAIKKDEYQTFKIPDRWLKLHYYEALNILFRIENALRVFVYSTLKNEFHEKWAELNIMSDDSEEGTIASIAKKRLSQAQNYGYLGYSIKCPIMSLTSGELIRLIISDSYWKYFKKYFLGSKDIIKNKLNEFGAIRNSLAHFRPIKEDDVEVIKQNAKHALMSIEKCLTQMVNVNNVIPTNLTNDWYKQLSTLGSELCHLRFFQCKDEQWIKIQINFQCSVLKVLRHSKSYRVYRAINLISSAILKEYQGLSNLLTYLSENVPYSVLNEEESPVITKELSFVFSRDILHENYKIVKDDIENLLLHISTETELIKEDNLARGKILDVALATASLRESERVNSYWSVDLDKFKCPVKEDDPPEYWGEVEFYIDDFVAGINKYPWMPEGISEIIEPPF